MSLYNFARFDGLRPEDIAKFATKRFEDLTRDPVRLGERVLPWEKRDEWTEEVGKLTFRPVASAVIAPDSVLPLGPLGTDSSATYDILKAGRKYRLIESEIKKLRQVFHAGQRVSAETIIRSRPYQLANALVVGYLDLAEAMRWEVLTTGQYVIPRSGNVAVDYGLPASHKVTLTTTDRWSQSASADGLQDLLDWDDALLNATGSHSAYTFMSTTAVQQLLAQDKVRQKLAIAGYAGIGGMVAQAGTQQAMEFFMDQLNAYLARYQVGPVIVYDRKYNLYDEIGNTQPTLTRYLPVDRFAMVGQPGIETNPGFGNGFGYQIDGPVVQNNFNPGLYVWLTEQDEPYEVQIKSEGWTLPILMDGNALVCGKLD